MYVNCSWCQSIIVKVNIAALNIIKMYHGKHNFR